MDAIDELLIRAVDKIYPSKEKLEQVLRSGSKLRLYQGFDPTGIQLHIGHMVGLRKLRQFQELGHHVIFLIGDGTGQAGDPSGKTRSREKYLSQDTLRKNAKDYVLQAAKIVRFEGLNPAEILYNGDWLNKLELPELLDIANHFTLQQLEERDMFVERKKKGIEINLREFLYPLLQGYDSVAMNVDLEIGGTDQTFNMLTGRKLVKEYLHKEKYVLTLPLLEDASGKKIGKTEGNVIALTSDPSNLYGMIMNLPDNVIIKCFEFITDIPMDDIKTFDESLKKGENPMIYKKKLAFLMVKMLNDENQANRAQSFFENTFQKRILPENVKAINLDREKMTILDLVVSSGCVNSSSETRRLITAGSVTYDNVRYTDITAPVGIKNGSVLKVGKHRFIKTYLK